jgi:hypothetical protein
MGVPRWLRLTVAAFSAAALVVVVALGNKWADRKLSYLPRQMLAQADPGWMDVFRKTFTIPPLGALPLRRTTEGDGCAAFTSAVRRWEPGGGRLPPSPAADSDSWRSAAADANLDQVVAAARMRGCGRTSAAFPPGDSASFYLTPPPFVAINIAIQGLNLRARQRLSRHDLAGAQTDLAALLALGDQLLRHDPTTTGMTAGGQAVRVALPTYAAWAQARRDTAALARLAALKAWAEYRPPLGTNPILCQAVPDSALRMATDTSLALGWREAMLFAFASGQLITPRSVLLGVPRRSLDTLRALSRTGDTEFARLAGVALRALEEADRATPVQRWRSALLWTTQWPM